MSFKHLIKRGTGYIATVISSCCLLASCNNDVPDNPTPGITDSKEITTPLQYLNSISESDLATFYAKYGTKHNPSVFTFKNYLGNNQNIHPKVLYFPDKWNGWRYYMAYTPYPNGSTNAENPCIAVSDDGVNWCVPDNFTNPLALAPSDGYNSDTHLVYVAETDQLECWWRIFSNSKSRDSIVRRISKDGKTWSATETIFSFESEEMAKMSPCISVFDGKYVMVSSTGHRLRLHRSKVEVPRFEWDAPEYINFDFTYGDTAPRIWHLDMIGDDPSDMEAIACCFYKGESNNSADLYYFKLNLNELHGTMPQLILKRSDNNKDIDSRSLYRSSMIKIDDTYLVYFSCIDQQWKRAMSLAYGKSILDLKSFPLP